jgi:hypothetical protein
VERIVLVMPVKKKRYRFNWISDLKPRFVSGNLDCSLKGDSGKCTEAMSKCSEQWSLIQSVLTHVFRSV